ncbi:MAG TPA: DJ-1/PfpI family protein [Kofleriaceae bacterium]|nr:DJ-1/PfpI family protein [Kofleriaceae bacterium]
MPSAPRVVIIGFEGVQTLDLTGPAEVFAAASRSAGRAVYRVVIASVGGGVRTTTCGLTVRTVDLRRIRPGRRDTVVVAGGETEAVRRAVADRALLGWLGRAAPVVQRVASVCSGAFLLAAAGLLDGRRAATHWEACDELARRFPRVTVDPNAIFVRDGAVWTSAGVTTGIDMALAIVEDDLGRALADAVAARLVLYIRRPGFQSQFSAALVAQAAGDTLGPAIAWTRANLAAADVEALARRAGLSVRTLHRRCLAQLATTPARLIEKLRVEHARTLLATSDHPAKVLATRCGFGNPTRMKRAFEREIGIGPREYRVLHGGR